MTTLNIIPPPTKNETGQNPLVTMTTEQVRAMNSALKNHLILSNIFANLPTDQLKHCRLVAGEWEKMASLTLLHEDRCTIKLVLEGCEFDLTLLNTWYEQESDWDRDNDPQSSYENHPLKCLNTILDQSPTFPCTHLTLYCDQDTSAFDYQEWTEETRLARKVCLSQIHQGGKFKTLRIQIEGDCNYKICVKLFAQLMTTILVNVEKLVCVENIGFGSDDVLENVRNVEPFLLPSLTFIKWGGGHKYCEPIMRAAVNLKKMFIHENDVDQELLNILQECGKTAALRPYKRICPRGNPDFDFREVDGDGWKGE